MKRIVLCADDFALNQQASQGIIALARSGRLSATSVMVLAPRWSQDAAGLRELRGRIDVGLHLDWTSDFALAQGHGMSLGAVMRRAVLRGLDEARARVVIERQLDAFELHWKAPPDHVDGHQHVQQFDGIRQALVAALRQRYGAPLPYLRVSRVVATGLAFKSRIITAMGASDLQRLADGAQIAHAKWLVGSYDFAPEPTRYARLMQLWLGDAPDGCIIMCHPAQPGAQDDPIAAARAVESDYLASAAWPAALQQNQAVLARGAGLFGAAG